MPLTTLRNGSRQEALGICIKNIFATEITQLYQCRKQNEMMPIVNLRNISYNIENLNRY